MSLMKDERSGPVDALVKGVLLVLSWFYGLAVKLIDLAYRSGLRKKRRVPVPVISVGNLTLGGTGKTPFAIFLADHFTAAGRKPAVLTRGYGGDESRMLKDELADVPVVVGQDRVRSALWAASAGSDVVILDDAFQHRRIARDLDILMLDGARPFGNRHLFPRGTLREPASAIERADMLVLTKTDRISSAERESLAEDLARSGKPVILTRYRPTFFNDVTGAAYPPEFFRGKKVCLVSGIADADYFARMIEQLGAEITARRDHGDHHRYTRADVSAISGDLAAGGAEAVVVTRKDHVKLRDLDIAEIEDKLYVLNVVVDVVDGKERLIAGLNSVVNG